MENNVEKKETLLERMQSIFNRDEKDTNLLKLSIKSKQFSRLAKGEALRYENKETANIESEIELLQLDKAAAEDNLTSVVENALDYERLYDFTRAIDNEVDKVESIGIKIVALEYVLSENKVLAEKNKNLEKLFSNSISVDDYINTLKSELE